MLVNFLLMCVSVLALPRRNPALAREIRFGRGRTLQRVVGAVGALVLAGYLAIHVVKDLDADVGAWYLHSTWIWIGVLSAASVVFAVEWRRLKRNYGQMEEGTLKYPDDHDLGRQTMSSEGDAGTLRRRHLRFAAWAVVFLSVSSDAFANGQGAAWASFRDLGDVRQAVITSHHDLARRLGERGAYEEAEEHFDCALAMTRRLYPDASLQEAALLDDLATVLGEKGQHAAAEALLRRALRMRVELLGEEHARVAQTRYMLGNLLHDQRDLDAAELHYRQAADGMARSLPEDHPAQVYLRVAIARLLLDRGDAGAAQSVLCEALARLAAIHAPGHWRIADAESLLGASLAAQGRHAEAEGLMRPAYVTLQEQRGGRSPSTRRALARLADLYRSREQNLHAEQFLDGWR
jgi:tetratricopeptide (TPR) repeat protein